jgi:hypothetical protein
MRTQGAKRDWQLVTLFLGIACAIVVLTAAASATAVSPTTTAAVTAKDPSLISLHAPIELTSPLPTLGASFGASVAAGVGYVAIGSSGATYKGFTDAGNVSIFNASTGHLITSIVSPNAKVDGFFGFDVAASGSTLVVGAPNETAQGTFLNAGNAYIYTVTKGVPTLSKTLKEPAPQKGTSSSVGGAFGYSVATTAADVLVGAANENSGSTGSAGNAYVFATNGTFLNKFTTPNPTVYGRFGWSVAISGSTAYVGAPYENSGGHAYMILGATGPSSGTTTYTLADPDPQDGATFGLSVAVSGASLVVGDPDHNATGYFFSGAAYLFSSSTGLLTFALANPQPADSGNFGWAVAVNGDDVVVGAPDEIASGLTTAGNVTIFNGSSGAIVTTLVSPNIQSGGFFGFAVASSGSDIVVGAPDETANGMADAGHAYIY